MTESLRRFSAALLLALLLVLPVATAGAAGEPGISVAPQAGGTGDAVRGSWRGLAGRREGGADHRRRRAAVGGDRRQ